MIYIKKRKIIRYEDEKIINYKGQRILHMEGEGHGAPQSRREFFGRMLGASLAFTIMPSLPTLLSKGIYAQECADTATGGDTSIPILIIDFAGGISFPSTLVPLAADGSFLPDYSRYGYPNVDPTGVATDAFSIDTRLGYPMFGAPANYVQGGNAWRTGASGFIEGFFFDLLQDGTNPEVYNHSPNGVDSGYSINLNNIDSVFIAGESNSDTNTNMLAAGPGMAKLGVSGLLSPFFGETAPGGGRHQVPPGFEGYVPNIVNSQNDIQAQATLGGISTAPGMNVDKAKKLFRTMETTLSASQLSAFKNKSLNEQVDIALKCGYIKAEDLAGRFNPTDLVDPTNAALAAAFSTTNATVSADRRVPGPDSLVAGLVQLALGGYAKVVVEQRGGYDNHRGAADIRPLDSHYMMGELARAAIQYAQSLNEPLAIMFTSDGGMSANDEEFMGPNGLVHRVHPGDRDANAGQFMIVTSPKIDRSTNSHVNSQMMVGGQPKRNLGSFESNGVNDNDAFFSNSVTDQAKMQVALYAQMNGLTGPALQEAIGGSTDNYDQFHFFNDIKKDS